MASLKVKGGCKLQGEIFPQGAKNEAMQILCACLLTDEKVTIHNLPDILDINNLITLLEGMGVTVERTTRHDITLRQEQWTRRLGDSCCGTSHRRPTDY